MSRWRPRAQSHACDRSSHWRDCDAVAWDERRLAGGVPPHRRRQTVRGPQFAYILVARPRPRLLNGRHHSSPRPDCRRSAGHPQRAAVSAPRRGLRRRRGALACGGAGTHRGGGLRSRDPGPELHARHDVRAGRPRPARAHQGDRPDAAGARDHRLEQRRRRGRGDAARRPRLHREAVGRRAAAGDGADPDRPAARGQADAPAAGGALPAAARRAAGLHRRLGRDHARCGRRSSGSRRPTRRC